MKMVRFDFVVTEDDADAILTCVHNTIGDCHKQILDLMRNDCGQVQESQIDWLNRRIVYLDELKLKMKHKQVECS